MVALVGALAFRFGAGTDLAARITNLQIFQGGATDW